MSGASWGKFLEAAMGYMFLHSFGQTVQHFEQSSILDI